MKRKEHPTTGDEKGPKSLKAEPYKLLYYAGLSRCVLQETAEDGRVLKVGLADELKAEDKARDSIRGRLPSQPMDRFGFWEDCNELMSVTQLRAACPEWTDHGERKVGAETRFHVDMLDFP